MKTYPEMNEKIAGILRLGAEPEQYAAQYIEELRAENAALQRQINENRKSRIELAQILNNAFNNYCKKYRAGIVRIIPTARCAAI